MKRQAVILAGGLGTRLRPLTEKIPKPMVEVAGQPFLHWQLLDLKMQGYTDILLLVAYLGEQIEAFFGNGSQLGMSIQYSYESEPMGTGGALRNALALLEEDFLLLNGDSFLKAPLDSMVRIFETSDVEALISVYDNRVPVPVIPNVQMNERKVLAYKKDAGLAAGFDMIDSGIYVMKRQLIARFIENRYLLEKLWPDLIKDGKLGAFLVSERFYDIGTPERLQEFEEKVRDYFKNPVSN